MRIIVSVLLLVTTLLGAISGMQRRPGSRTKAALSG